MQAIIVRFIALVFIMQTLILTGCSVRQPMPEISGPPAFDPTQFKSGEVYSIDPAQSYLHIYVYRSGPMAKLGHNHVISTNDIDGKIYRHALIEKSGMVLRLPVTSFEVDNLKLRQAAGEQFSSVPTAQDIAGTKHNMLSERVLNAAEYPDIKITSVTVKGSGERYLTALRFEVAGHTRDLKVPATVTLEPDLILIDGNIPLRQSDLGLTPFSVMLGALSVADEMQVRFHLTAVLDKAGNNT